MRSSECARCRVVCGLVEDMKIEGPDVRAPALSLPLSVWARQRLTILEKSDAPPEAAEHRYRPRCNSRSDVSKKTGDRLLPMGDDSNRH